MSEVYPESGQPQDGSCSTDPAGLLIVAAALVFNLYAVLNSQPLQSANDRSRWCTVWSLVERGTYQIDQIDVVHSWSTIDKVRHRHGEGEPYHFYSSKPPLFPTIVAGLYWLEKHTLGYSLFDDTTLVTRLLLVIINAVPMFFALLSLRKSLRLLNVSGAARYCVLMAAGFASMLNPFLTTLNNHTPAVVCLMFGLSALVRIQSASQPRTQDFAVLGFTAALTCCFELPAALFGVLSLVVAARSDLRKTMAAYVPAALVPLIAFFVTNWICTGGLKPFYTYYGTEKYVYVHEGIPSYWSEPKGIDANQESTPVYLFHCLVGHHGIFSLTPVFLLTLAGWGLQCCRPQPAGLRTVLKLGSGVTLIVLVFYLTRTQNYNYGGNSSALRWMLWLTPFWWYGMLPAIEKLVQARAGQVLIIALILPSMYSTGYSLTEPWKPSWLFRSMEHAGWIDYRTKILPFNPPRYSVLGKVPVPDLTIHFDGTGDAAGNILRIDTLVPFSTDVGMGVILQVEFLSQGTKATSDTSDQAIVAILADEMQRGEDISFWLKSFAAELMPQQNDDGATPADSTAAKSFVLSKKDLQPAPAWVLEKLRGLPTPRAYNAASPRYLQYTRESGEKTAVRCDRGASRVSFEHPEFGRCWQRCDVFYCDRLPLGVAQWTVTITQDRTNKLVRRETWTCRELP